MTGVLTRQGGDPGHTGKKATEADTVPRAARVVGSRQELRGMGRDGPSPSASPGHASMLGGWPPPCERTDFGCFKPPGFGGFYGSRTKLVPWVWSWILQAPTSSWADQGASRWQPGHCPSIQLTRQQGKTRLLCRRRAPWGGRPPAFGPILCWEVTRPPAAGASSCPDPRARSRACPGVPPPACRVVPHRSP